MARWLGKAAKHAWLSKPCLALWLEHSLAPSQAEKLVEEHIQLDLKKADAREAPNQVCCVCVCVRVRA